MTYHTTFTSISPIPLQTYVCCLLDAMRWYEASFAPSILSRWTRFTTSWARVHWLESQRCTAVVRLIPTYFRARSAAATLN